MYERIERREEKNRRMTERKEMIIHILLYEQVRQEGYQTTHVHVGEQEGGGKKRRREQGEEKNQGEEMIILPA